MPKYQVELLRSTEQAANVEIDAANEEEAEKKAEELKEKILKGEGPDDIEWDLIDEDIGVGEIEDISE